MSFMRIAVLVMVQLIAVTALAGTPPVMNFQARFSDATGAPIADGAYSISFTVYDAATGGQAVWTETQNVVATDGICAVLLGSSNPLNAQVFAEAPRYIGVQVAGEPEVSPRTEIATVPYAFQAGSAETSANAGLTPDTAWISPYFRAIDNPGSLALTIISIYNADTTSNLVTLSFYNETGALVDACSQTIAVGAAWIFRSNQSSCLAVTNHEGFVKVTAEGPIAPSGVIMTAALGSPTMQPASVSLTFFKI